MKKKVLKIGFIIFVSFVLLFSLNNNVNAASYAELQAKYPQGKYWNHVAQTGHGYNGVVHYGSNCNCETSVTSTPCSYHNGYAAPVGDVDCNYFDGGQECLGFARRLYYEYYGYCAPREGNDLNINNLQAGDILTYYQDNQDINPTYGHTVWVTGVSGDTIYIAECNWGNTCKIDWNQRFLSKSAVTVYNIQKAPYELITNSDNEAPKISASVEFSMTADMYKIVAKVSDNVGVTDVKFPTWTQGQSGNDAIWHQGIHNSSTGNWEYVVKKSEHNNVVDLYYTHVYAYDAAGNYAKYPIEYIPMGSTVANLGNFTARITPKDNTNYAIGLSNTSSGSDLLLKSKSQSDSSQLWKFTRNSNGYYTIQNVSTGLMMDVREAKDVNGARIQLWDSNTSAAQQFYIMNFNGSYRIVSNCSSNLKGVDIYGGDFVDGTIINLYSADRIDNNAQTLTFEKAVTSITATSSMTLEVGGTKTISTTVSPSDAYNKKLSFTSGNTNVATVDANGKVTAKGSGTTTITVKTTDGSNISKTCNVTVENNNYANISYLTHIENVGYETPKSNGETAGRPGAKLRLEEIKIELDSNVSGTIEYRTHVQNVGWLDYVTEGNYSGTHGKGLRLEAIQIRLTGEIANYYDVYYRIHVEDEGWLGWAMNNQKAGSVGYAKKLEGIQVVLVEKGGAAPGTVGDSLKRKVRPTESYSKGDITKDGLVDSADMATFLNIDDPTDMEFITCDMNMDGFWNEIDMDIMKDYYILNSSPVISYTTHVQNVGWQKYVSDGAMAGTSNKGLRLEGIKIKLDKVSDLIPGSVKYSTHIQNIGWQDFRYDDEMSGTSGKGLRLEAIKIELEGELAKVYDVYYRVHAQNVGWLGWAKNGQESGTAGFGYRLEGIEIQLVEKDAPAPGSTINCFVKK